MADSKITALTAISTVDPTADPLVIVDVSDTSMAASGTTKKSTINQLLGAGGTATLASATITGDLTVDTSTLKADSANNAVGVGTASPTANTLTIGANRFIICSDSQSKFGDNGLINGAAADGNTQIQFFGSKSLFFNEGVATRMTLNSTGLGVGTSPSFKLDVQGSGIRLNSGSATGFALLRLGGTASDSFFGFAGNANDIVTGSSAGDTVIGSNKAGANLRFISGNGVLNATLDASGNLLVGVTATPSGSIGGGGFIADTNSRKQLYLATTSAASQVLAVFLNPNGSVGTIETNGSSTAYNISSDYRLKDEVKPLTGALNRINALKPSTYKWKVDGSAGEGFIAHELAEVVPFAVSGQKDAVNADGSMKTQGVDLSKIIPILVAAVQELTARVQTLETR